MKNYLKNLDTKLLKVIRLVGKEADKRGVKAYLVGGVVRDIILKRKNLDLDIVIEGDAVAFAKKVSSKLRIKPVIYNEFKTATVPLYKNLHVDFASARKEVYKASGALPRVSLGSLEEDIFRRDFTINTLAICINKDKFGKLIDMYGGLKDLKDKKIRVLHNESFVDDPTRILRAVRFEQRFGFALEHNTFVLLKSALKTKKEKNVSSLRYFSEFKKNLKEDEVCKQIQRLDKLNGLGFIDSYFKCDLRNIRILDKKLSKKRNNLQEEWIYYMFALLEKQGDGVKIRAAKRFQFNKEIKNVILQSRDIDSIIKNLSRTKLSHSEIYMLLRDKNEFFIAYLKLRVENKLAASRINQFLNKLQFIEPILKGDDLMKMGIQSGKEIGKILEYIKLNKIDGSLKTKKQELEIVMEEFLK